MIKTLVIWDYDNTLADTIDCLTLAYEDLCYRYQLPMVTRAEVEKIIAGYPNDIFGKVTTASRNEVSMFYHERCVAHSEQTVSLFNDTIKWLEYLKSMNIMQVIMSNKITSEIETECRRFNIMGYFERVIGVVPRWESNGVRYKKPELEFAKPTLQELQPDRVVVIGDGLTDIQFAQNMGAKMIWLSNEQRQGIISCSHDELLSVLKRVFVNA